MPNAKSPRDREKFALSSTPSAKRPTDSNTYRAIVLEGGFRIPQSHRMTPGRAILLCLAGGLVVLASGLAEVYIPTLAVFAPAVLVAVGLISGTLILVGALGLWMVPRRHMLWGLIVVLSSVPSLLIGGGLLGVLFPIGFMLSLVGGILAVQWKPRPVAPPTLRARRVAKTR